MREQLEAWREEGLSRADVAQGVQMLATREIQTSAEARQIYRDRGIALVSPWLAAPIRGVIG